MVMGIVPLGMFIIEMRLLREIEGMLLITDRIYECEERKGVHETGAENRNRSETQEVNDV